MKRNEQFPKSVYQLKLDDNIVYVGATHCELKKRLAEHKCSQTYDIFIRHSDSLTIELIDTIKNKEELYKENYWIEKYKSEGLELFNQIQALYLDYESTGNSTKKTYNKEYATEYYKEWRAKNKEKWNNYMRNYKRNHK